MNLYICIAAFCSVRNINPLGLIKANFCIGRKNFVRKNGHALVLRLIDSRSNLQGKEKNSHKSNTHLIVFFFRAILRKKISPKVFIFLVEKNKYNIKLTQKRLFVEFATRSNACDPFG